jgi:hypothetical protein
VSTVDAASPSITPSTIFAIVPLPTPGVKSTAFSV